MKKISFLILFSFVVTFVSSGFSQWIINEIHADPASDLTGDANGDGTRYAYDDEFVELINNTVADVDISGWTLSDGSSIRHVFPASTVIPDGCAIVVFGGGTPTGSFGNVTVQIASSGQLSLNNSGDTVTLNNGTSDVVSYTYGTEGGDNQSLTRDPDISGTDPLVKHSTATGSGGALFSPGTKVDGSNFSGCSTSNAPEIDIQRPAGTSIVDGGIDDVGNQNVGTVNLTYTIDNSTGTAQLNVTSAIATNLTNSSNFSVVTSLPLNIAAGNTTTLQLSFNVDAAGAFSFDIDFTTND